jgi:NADP-dependent 3-hydroxy acid dehydrogenase YdfG
VSIGSVADHIGLPGNSGYAASKFGLRGLHEVLRAELEGTGVRSTLVSPGPVDTAMWDEVDPDSRPGFTPRARMLEPGSVAAAVMFAIEQPPDVNVGEIRIART